MLPLLDAGALLDTKAVALWLGISERTVRLWAECSELPHLRLVVNGGFSDWH